MSTTRKKTWLTNTDIEQHLADTLMVDDDIPDIGDNIEPIAFDAAQSLRVFINTFADRADRIGRRIFGDGLINRIQPDFGINAAD
jgi:hypothetical protein